MAILRSEGTLKATASVGYPNGLSWTHQWIKTSLYLGRLREVYSADPVNNVDLMAIVDAFMIGCAHMWDALKNDPELPDIGREQVEAAMKGNENLRLCRDYANTEAQQATARYFVTSAALQRRLFLNQTRSARAPRTASLKLSDALPSRLTTQRDTTTIPRRKEPPKLLVATFALTNLAKRDSLVLGNNLTAVPP